eukprot:s2082_g3.t1
MDSNSSACEDAKNDVEIPVPAHILLHNTECTKPPYLLPMPSQLTCRLSCHEIKAEFVYPRLKFACEVKCGFQLRTVRRGLATIRGILSHLRNMDASAKSTLAPVALDCLQKEWRCGAMFQSQRVPVYVVALLRCAVGTYLVRRRVRWFLSDDVD